MEVPTVELVVEGSGEGDSDEVRGAEGVECLEGAGGCYDVFKDTDIEGGRESVETSEPHVVGENGQEGEVTDEKSDVEAFVQEELFRQKSPVNSPLEHENSPQIERSIYVGSPVVDQEWTSQIQLDHPTKCQMSKS